MSHRRTMQLNKAVCLLGLLLLPLSGFADGMTNFFSPPSSDISLQIMQAIFGTGTDALNGKLIRPLLMVMCSGMVILMGAVFAWNLTKFVLHTAQEGEMMVGKGKQMGLVVLRSVFGISMVIPVYGGAYKGLCMSFILVAWLITQGIGLADRGVNAVVDYLTAGGTIYQVAQSTKDTAAKEALAAPAVQILAAESCLYKLKNIRAAREKVKQETAALDAKARGLLPGVPTPMRADDIWYSIDAAAGQAKFGTRYASDTGANPRYFNECGTVNWPTDSNPNKSLLRKVAVQQMIVDLAPVSQKIAAVGKMYDPAAKAQMDALSKEVPVIIGAAVFKYVDMIAPLRVDASAAANNAAYNTLQSIKQKGWIVLGAYYPMMGNLNQSNKQALNSFTINPTQGALATGPADNNSESVYNTAAEFKGDENRQLIAQHKYVLTNEAQAKAFITYTELANSNGTLQEQLANPDLGQIITGPFQGERFSDRITDPFSGDYAGAARSNDNVRDSAHDFISGGVLSGDDWIKRLEALKDVLSSAGNNVGYGLNKATEYSASGFTSAACFFGLSCESSTTGSTIGGLLAHDKLVKSATTVGIAAAVGGPIAWVSIPPMLIVFVDIVDKFIDAIDQTQNADPLIALQDFGFYTMDKAVMLLMIIFGGTFIASALLSWIPSINAVGSLGASANFIGPLIALFFSAIAAAGVGFGVYIPMIPFIVWVSAILGWIGHGFQAIIGAPLVALRMTTAEGEGLLGGAVEGVMMLLGVLLTPFLLVVGFSAALILIKQLMILINYLFSIFAFHSFGARKDTYAWIVIGVPAILFVYFTLIVTVVQAICTKLIGEFPGEVLRHLHSAMTGHKAAEQMMGKMEQSTEKLGGHSGELSGKGGYFQLSQGGGGGKKGGGDKKK